MIARGFLVACGLSLALGGVSIAQAPADSSSRRAPLLEVPYLPQSELLCGGAALAMVERYFGRRGVYAEDFANLVDPAEHGIRTTALAAAASGRGWDVRAFDGTVDQVQAALHDSIPVIALIEVAPNRYHYVVLLGWARGLVAYHDPAIGPSRSVAEAHFLETWEGGQRWAMVLAPRPPEPQAQSTPIMGRYVPPPCASYLAPTLGGPLVTLAQIERASGLLEHARLDCPDAPVLLRDLAGIRFKQHRYAEADSLALRYLELVPVDTLGWDLLASTRYLEDDRLGALDAWNAIGRPVVDLVRIDGVRRVHFGVINTAIGIRHGTMLRREALVLGRRRSGDIPALTGASIGYQPVPGGRAEVRAAVAERPLLAPWWALMAANGASALARSEIGVSLASPLGFGEVWTGAWRWDHAHPLVDFDVGLPGRLGIPGVLEFEGGWERFRYATASPFEESRRRGSVSFGSWISSALRPSLGFRIEHWSDDRHYLAGIVALEFRGAGDRLSIRGSAEPAAGFGSQAGYLRGSLRADWASSFGLRRTSWGARLGADAADEATPLGLQPMASGDIPLAVPLRAHPWTRDGLIPVKTIGRTILSGGVSGDQPILRTALFTVAAGIFLDGAEVRRTADGSGRDRFYLDAGGGLRFGLLDGSLGVIRVDLATGLTDRTTALTVGLHQEWPTFRGRTH